MVSFGMLRMLRIAKSRPCKTNIVSIKSSHVQYNRNINIFFKCNRQFCTSSSIFNKHRSYFLHKNKNKYAINLNISSLLFSSSSPTSSISSTPQPSQASQPSSQSSDPDELYRYEGFKTESDSSTKIIFELIFGEISAKMGGDHNMVLPKDIMWLCGAPGSGKGEMTEWIKYQRGYHSHPIRISEILAGPEIEEIKSSGKLVSDRLVFTLLLERLLLPDYKTGVIVDGFPRTHFQAECIKLLFDKMLNLRRSFDGTLHFTKFRRPVFHITVLYVDQSVSIERQLRRGKLQLEHNKRVMETGIGELIDIRDTDISEEKAQQRYKYFHDHIYTSIQSIKEKFPFHFISAEATIDNVKNRVLKELEYQSSSELGDDTFDMVRQVSLASEIKQDARHKLVTRLDGYTRDHKDLFQQVINVFKYSFEPHVRQQALTGTCIVSSENEIFRKYNGIGLTMMLDLLAERGYRVILDVIKTDDIVKIDLDTGNIIKSNDGSDDKKNKKKVFKFHINFPPPKMRHAVFTYETDVSVVQ